MAISDYVAIDPLALVLPSAVYVRLVEKFSPHVPKVAEISEAAKGMTAEETAEALGHSVHIVRHDLRLAQAWLRRDFTRRSCGVPLPSA